MTAIARIRLGRSNRAPEEISPLTGGGLAGIEAQKGDYHYRS
jgi:hypothetical protein